MRLSPFFLSCLIILQASTAQAGGHLSLTLKDSIRMAVEKNLDVRAELYYPAQLEADINRNRSIYDPLLELRTDYVDSTKSPVGSVTSDNTFHSQSFQLNSTLSQLLWTGARTSIYFDNSYTGSNSQSGTPNYWQTGLGVSFDQPLLKNSGREATELLINISRLSKFASLEHFNSRLLSTVAQVRTDYFKLHSLLEDQDVKKVSLELSRKILSDTKSRVKAGVLPAMEVLNAEFGVVTREKELIDAVLAVANQIDVLRLLLQLDQTNPELKLIDLPARTLPDIDEKAAIAKALERPDIREQKRNLAVTELQTRVFRNRIAPDLAFNASASLTGNDRTYQGNLDKVVTFDYPVWSVGLNLTFPLGNNAAENDYRKSRLKTEQTALQIRSLEESAANEVKASIRGLKTGFKQIEVADRGRAFAEERLRAFIRKNEVGLATTKEVLEVENDLAVSKSNQIKAVVGYANAMTRYWQVTGELLELEGVRIVEGDADKLYLSAR